MTKDEIAQAMQDSAGNSWGNEAHFQRFAALVAAAERESCAELAFEMLVKVEGVDFDVPDAIRARGASMTEDIEKMAREAGVLSGYESDLFKRFAAIVATRCAEIAYEAEPFHSADLIRKAFGVNND